MTTCHDCGAAVEVKLAGRHTRAYCQRCIDACVKRETAHLDRKLQMVSLAKPEVPTPANTFDDEFERAYAQARAVNAQRSERERQEMVGTEPKRMTEREAYDLYRGIVCIPEVAYRDAQENTSLILAEIRSLQDADPTLSYADAYEQVGIIRPELFD